MSDYILELKDVVKTFGGVTALGGVHFQLKKGEIHALMGENGAGKSTFIKVITGVHQPDSGLMLLEGEKVTPRNTEDSAKLGIAAIYQHVTAFPDLTVTENIFMGQEIKNKFGFYNWPEMTKRAKELIAPLSKNIDVNKPMSALSVAQQQLVEIAKALSRDARILIMDEPTASLSKKECEELYQIAERLRDEGVSIILITHRFEDMYRLASRVTVFRDSQYVGTYDVDGITNADLITAMVGREIKDLFPKPKVELGEEVLRVENLTRTGFFKNVSFAVKKGEILGLTGLVGAGRTEVVQTIFGVEHFDSGKVYLEGKEVNIKKPIDAMKYGIGLLPEDRQKQGLILDWGIGRNITLPELASYGKNGLTNEKKERQVAKELAERVDTKVVTVFDKANTLSGGNQQKVVVAKILSSDLKVIILDEPTKGVDVGAKAEIYEIMGELAQQGYAIIMISSEMPEILGMCDRIMIMCEGRITGELMREAADQESILKYAMAKSLKATQE